MIAFGKLPGDWEHYLDESKMLAAIEPVTEGIMQLFCQTIILYIVSGPGENHKHNRPIDFRHLVYDDDDLKSMILYGCLLATSLISVGISLAKVSMNTLNMFLTFPFQLMVTGKKSVVKKIISFQFLKLLIMIITKFLIQAYLMNILVK